MINAPQLLADLTRQLKALEADLRQRIADQPALRESLQGEWQTAIDAKRTNEPFQSWADQVITQAGVHWLLSCTFLRFVEDNGLVERPWLAGTPESGRLALARDRHEAYFRAHPTETDREYLLACFREAAALPGLHTFFDEAHNPVFRLGPSGDAAMALRAFWQQVDPNSGTLLHDFTDETWNTRFLGDLYQELSEATRDRYALLQTPEFVEEFILDRTLTPAISTFGFREARIIDPTCGSGHFLLGGFARLVTEWQRHEPGRNARDISQKALDAVAGVDLNPFAVAISRFRLLVAALRVAGVRRLADAPDFRINVAIGDSLLHGTRFGLTATDDMLGHDQYQHTGLAHAYASEDLAQVQQILSRQYHAVVGNPPYIVVGDSALNAAYRKRYTSCYRQYSLGCPFTERFFELAITGERFGRAGFVGLITTSTFMKREFGSKLIEKVLPRLDLTHVIDTSGAEIPGHGTPTVILLGCHRPPHDDLYAPGNTVRVVMGIKGEPNKPEDPAEGLVWRAIVEQIDHSGSESEFVSVADTQRATLSKHPWSIGGGGAAELRELIEHQRSPLRSLPADLGYLVITGEDNCLMLPLAASRRLGFTSTMPIVEGDRVRDWTADSDLVALWPYGTRGQPLPAAETTAHVHGLWRYRTSLKDRKAFGVPVEQRGLKWWDLREVYSARLDRSLTIAFGEVATRNHFVLDRGGKVFKQTAPVIKLPAGSSEDDHLGLLGLLNSAIACFWLMQVCQKKGAHLAGKRTREERYAFNATNVANFPLPPGRPLTISRQIDNLAQEIAGASASVLLGSRTLPDRNALDSAARRTEALRRQMIAAQEELDWQCYRLFGMLPEGYTEEDVEAADPPELQLGERAFEIVLARRIAAGEESATWFERHGSTPRTELPTHWPADYQAVVNHRIALIESDRNIGLIERPEFKRRWNTPAWAELEKAALRDWLLDRLEQPTFWPASADTPPQLSTTSRLADLARADAAFMQVAGLYAGHADFDMARLVAELVAGEAVPLLPVQRYTGDGLRKRAQWQDTWALQRREDAGEAVGTIPVPPKYDANDFLKADFSRLRGALDVPKERFVSFPGAERGTDGSLVIAWAGWNHLQLATALAAYYLEMKENEGWEAARLQPLLAGLLELVPWLKQWHNEVDPAYGERMGDYYNGFVSEEARANGFTLDDLLAWKPAAAPARRSRRKAS